MGFRDFSTHRFFSENGPWQWYEKPGLSESRDRAKEPLITADALIVAPLMGNFRVATQTTNER
jgi:hypothetical protein